MAELGLAVIATIDLCLKHGQEIHRICSAFRGAETELQDRSLRIENGWFRCTTQLQFLRDAWDTMEEAHQDLQERTLHTFASKLTMATRGLQKVVKSEVVHNGSENELKIMPNPLKYAFTKDSLDKAIQVLDTWQQMSDPSWFLLLRSNRPSLASAISANKSKMKLSTPSVFGIHPGLRGTPSEQNHMGGLRLPTKSLGNMAVVTRIPLCSASIAKAKGSSKPFNYIFDPFNDIRANNYQPNTGNPLERDIQQLASRLRHSEPENFNLLQCKGFMERYQDQPLTMVFRAPAKLCNPRSLRYSLVKNGPPSSLSHRFAIAQQLARAVSYVHVYGFVHKSLCPENIILLDKDGDNPFAFLVGFGGFRNGLQMTVMEGDNDLEKNLYRHPLRQGNSPGHRYIMQHDIYSLGVCLLEIGLWTSFVDYDESDKTCSLSKVFHIDADASVKEAWNYLRNKSQSRFLELTRNELKVSMGSQYASITETCLNCLEPGNEDFGDPEDFDADLTEEEETQIGVQYIDKVLHRLGSLRV